MPVSMMMPIAGSRPKVSGSSSVMPASGPSPGSTPTMVPHRKPMKQYNSPFQDSATAKPPTSWSKPIIVAPRSKRPEGKLEAQQNLEKVPAGRHGDASREHRERHRHPRDDHQQHRPEQPEREIGAERLEQRRHRDHCSEHD